MPLTRTLRRDLLALAAFLSLGPAALLLARPAEAPPEPAPGARIAQRYTGVNLATGGFAAERLPGRYGFDYVYPTRPEAAPFLAAGMNTVRVPVLWERIQPAPYAPLDAAEMRRIDEAFAALKGFRMIVLDVHNYASYRGVKLDQPGRSGAMLADLWTKLAKRYAGDRRIAFGIMNEPVGLSGKAWAGIAAQTLRAVRATGARNLVLVPGTRWSGAHVWTEGGQDSSAVTLAPITDPANNIAFEMHVYVDGNASGTGNTCVAPDVAADRLKAATRWLRVQRARGFLGEFGAAPNPACLAALDSLLTVMTDASDVWLGWTYWAGGEWWGAYHLSIQPDERGPKPQLAVLRRHLAK